MHSAVGTSTHKIVATELNATTVTDAEILANLLKPTRRRIIEISGNEAYDKSNCDIAMQIKPAVPLFVPK